MFPQNAYSACIGCIQKNHAYNNAVSQTNKNETLWLHCGLMFHICSIGRDDYAGMLRRGGAPNEGTVNGADNPVSGSGAGSG